VEEPSIASFDQEVSFKVECYTALKEVADSDSASTKVRG
jgi:hypothetical protein